VTAVCEVRELPTMTALLSWARRHHTRVRYLGPDLHSHAVYAAEDGPVARVARTADRDPHPMPVRWRSPLERLEAAT
jgi:hypothetical protein